MSDMSDEHEREKARECYFAIGGVESDLGPEARDAKWYWRRAAMSWRERAESLGRKFARLGDAWKKFDPPHLPACAVRVQVQLHTYDPPIECSCGRDAILQELHDGVALAPPSSFEGATLDEQRAAREAKRVDLTGSGFKLDPNDTVTVKMSSPPKSGEPWQEFVLVERLHDAFLGGWRAREGAGGYPNRNGWKEKFAQWLRRATPAKSSDATAEARADHDPSNIGNERFEARPCIGRRDRRDPSNGTEPCPGRAVTSHPGSNFYVCQVCYLAQCFVPPLDSQVPANPADPVSEAVAQTVAQVEEKRTTEAAERAAKRQQTPDKPIRCDECGCSVLGETHFVEHIKTHFARLKEAEGWIRAIRSAWAAIVDNEKSRKRGAAMSIRHDVACPVWIDGTYNPAACTCGLKRLERAIVGHYCSCETPEPIPVGEAFISRTGRSPLPGDCRRCKLPVEG